ncbi:MAG: Transcriptional regulator, TrmB [uncultured bacterium]|nr:MAG: Transcriptional regulator, TrmB [uncultured bacterium]
MDQDLIQLLETAGFTEKEAQVYLALLELGQGTVTDVSRITKLKRSIIYVILEGLVRRGYASEIPERKINAYQATDPSVILLQLKGVTKNFSEMLPMLRTLGNKGKSRPKITYHETKEGIWKVWDEITLVDDAFFISSYERIEQHFPGANEKWIKGYNKKIHVVYNRHLVPERNDEIEIGKKFASVGERVRTLADLNEIKMDFTIYLNKIAITSLEENPFIVVIESEELVNSMKPLFEIAWAKGRNIES